MSSPKKINWHSIFSLRSILFTILGVLFAVVAMQGFLVPNNFLDGGVTGISILLLGIGNLHISVLLLICNLPFVFLGFNKLGYTFGTHAIIAILLLSAGMYFIEIGAFTEDKVLIALFGG